MVDTPMGSFANAAPAPGDWLVAERGEGSGVGVNLDVASFAHREANDNVNASGYASTLPTAYGHWIGFGGHPGGCDPGLYYHPVDADHHQFGLINNAFPTGAGAFTGAFSYRLTGAGATRYHSTGGAHYFDVAAPGTAGAAIAWSRVLTLAVDGVATFGIGRLVLDHPTGTASGVFYSAFRYNGTIIGMVSQNGTTGVTYATTSDGRLKRDIVDAGAAGAVIDAIRVRAFVFAATGDVVDFGFVAQELVEICPDAVQVGSDGPLGDDPAPADVWGVDASRLVPVLVAEIQDLRRRLAALEVANGL